MVNIQTQYFQTPIISYLSKVDRVNGFRQEKEGIFYPSLPSAHMHAIRGWLSWVAVPGCGSVPCVFYLPSETQGWLGQRHRKPLRNVMVLFKPNMLSISSPPIGKGHIAEF